ncbi:hypothetical protein [Streptomyces sp. NBC_00690]|nr:hypothetical protein [Streptomyces sp. NBC_00690]
MPIAFLETLGAPDGSTTQWTKGQIVVELKVASVVACVTHLGFSAR